MCPGHVGEGREPLTGTAFLRAQHAALLAMGSPECSCATLLCLALACHVRLPAGPSLACLPPGNAIWPLKVYLYPNYPSAILFSASCHAPFGDNRLGQPHNKYLPCTCCVPAPHLAQGIQKGFSRALVLSLSHLARRKARGEREDRLLGAGSLSTATILSGGKGKGKEVHVQGQSCSCTEGFMGPTGVFPTE